MSLYVATLAIHGIVAVVGIGLLGAIPIAAASARRAGPGAASQTLLEALFRYTRWSLAIMLVTGALIDFTVKGAFHESGWFRASFVLLFVVGFSHARARAALRQGLTSGDDAQATLRRVERWGWLMTATVTLIVVLMEVKPFP